MEDIAGPDGKVTIEFAEPFKSIIQPIQDDIARYNKAKSMELTDLSYYFGKIQNHIQYFFGCGLSKKL